MAWVSSCGTGFRPEAGATRRNPNNGTALNHPGHLGAFGSSVAATFSRDGTRAAVGGTDGRIVVWDRDY